MRPREFPAESLQVSGIYGRGDSASMRPREFPAESRPGCKVHHGVSGRFNEAAGVPRGIRSTFEQTTRGCFIASMRPREFPAESPRVLGRQGFAAQVASMRPREFPAESGTGAAHCHGETWASMRPREFPAESVDRDSRWRGDQHCFNEAAGVPRGIHEAGRVCFPSPNASMRPREFPAESP